MTIAEALKTSPHIDADILLAHVLKKPKEFLYIHPGKQLTSTQVRLFKLLAKRRTRGEPVAYLLGYKDFYGLRFKVTKDTLIPRPETEWLVERALQLLSKAGPATNVLDLGTGSGCIAISIAKCSKNKSATIIATDISKPALTVARQNARKHKVRVQCIQSNLLKNVHGKFDLIIANLPYVPYSDYKKLRKGLQYEPKSALTDGTNRFIHYQELFKSAAAHLTPDATILLEIDPTARPRIKKWVRLYLPTARLTFQKDLNKIWRYAEISVHSL